MILFSRYSNERDPRFAIRTDIIREDDRMIVRKNADGYGSHRHIAHMAEAEKRLLTAFQGTRFVPNRVLSYDAGTEERAASVSFEYLDGMTLEEAADQALARGEDQLEKFFDQYFREAGLLAGEIYRPSDRTEEIFGGTEFFEGLPACGTADIDLVLGNIIVSGPELHVIDYEWTFFDPVPFDYIRWRILHYYLEGNTKRLYLDKDRYMRRFGISGEMEKASLSMEDHFQKYVAGSRVPRRDLYEEVSPGFVSLSDIVKSGKKSGRRVLELSLYPDSGSGFSENTRVVFRTDAEGTAEIEFPVADISSVRIDPTEEACLMEILYLETDRGSVLPDQMPANGFQIDTGHILFTEDDPWVVVSGWPDTAEMLYIGIRITPLEISTVEEADFFALLAGTSGADRAKTGDLRNLLSARTALADTIRNGKPGQLIRASARLRRKPDPFGGFHPVLGNDPGGICFHLDQCVRQEGNLVLRGWCFDRTFGIDSISAEEPGGRVLARTKPEGYRQDVAELFGLDPMIPYEFYLRIPEELLKTEVTLVLWNLRGVLRETVSTAGKDGGKNNEGPVSQESGVKPVCGPDPEKFAELYGGTGFTRSFSCLSGGETGNPVVKILYAGDAFTAEKDSGLYYVVCSFPAPGEDLRDGDGGPAFAETFMKHLSRILKEDSRADLLYGDFLLREADGDGTVLRPVLSPDISPSLLASWNYFGPVFIVQADVLNRAAAHFPEGKIPAGTEYYDLLWRTVEEARHIVHIPEVLSRTVNSFWKADENSAGILNSHYVRTGIPAAAEADPVKGILKTRFELRNEPLISVIIPNRDHREDLEKCIRSIEERSTYRNLEYVIVENSSADPDIFLYYEELGKNPERVKIMTYEGGFNYSAINNLGAANARGEYLLFLNNDTEMIEEDSIRQMAGRCMMPGAGACGARLLYGDGTVQHAGVVIGYGGLAGHAFAGMPGEEAGYMNLICSAHEVSAVTAACLMVRREVFRMAGGFTEKLAVAFNDIDLCLKIREKGWSIIYDGEAVFSHYESKSRGYENSLRKRWRYEKEKAYFRERWAGILKDGDPFYHPKLALDRQDYSLAVPEEKIKNEQ